MCIRDRNNLSDASSNIVSLVGFKLAAKAPDAEHPYGHARFEYLAGLVVSVTCLLYTSILFLLNTLPKSKLKASTTMLPYLMPQRNSYD